MKGVLYPLALAGALLWSAPLAAQPAEWLIVEVAPLTGPAATVGTRLNKAAAMWADDVNARGGINGKKVKLITCNDEARPEKAVACARDAARDKAALVLAHSLTASDRAMQSVLVNGPAMIIASPDVAPTANTLSFQTSPTEENLAEAIAKFLQQQHISEIGMVAATDASGEVGVVSAKAVFDAAKIKLNLARVDLKATDATTQIASVIGSDTKLVYSFYSGGGAATVVKSFTNLGMKQPLMVNYANMSQAFTDVVKDFMPTRLLGTGVKAIVPATLEDAALRQRAEAFMAAYRAKYNEPADMINILGKFGADVVEAVLSNVADPADTKQTRAFLESTTIESLQRLRFSPTSHVGLGTDDALIAEFKNGEWRLPGPIP